MGLDTIAIIEKNQLFENVDAPNSLFAGTESLIRGAAGDINWIRGKYYNPLIQELVGISLYQETINNDTVDKIATILENQTESYTSEMTNRHYPIREIKELARWFRVAANNGCFLEGWW